MEMYGSLVNRVMENTKTPKLEIGMGVTECLWSDRHAWEIVAIKDDRHITIRKMDAKLPDGDSVFGEQNYILTSNENNRVINLFKTQTKGWRERIGRNGLGHTRFSVGHAEEYYDPTF